MDEFFCLFQGAWSAGAGLVGGVMLREPEVKASAGDMTYSKKKKRDL